MPKTISVYHIDNGLYCHQFEPQMTLPVMVAKVSSINPNPEFRSKMVGVGSADTEK